MSRDNDTLGFEKKYKAMFNTTQNFLKQFNHDLTLNKKEKEELDLKLEKISVEDYNVKKKYDDLQKELLEKQQATEEILKIKNELNEQLKELQQKNKNMISSWDQQKKSILSQISKLQEVKKDVEDEKNRETTAFQEAYNILKKQIDHQNKDIGSDTDDIVKYENKIMNLRAKEQMSLKNINDETEKFRKFLNFWDKGDNVHISN